MTPKDKAKKIHRRYMYILNDARIAKQCALIAVDEIMDALEKNGSWNAQYWEDVKQEIESI